MGDISKVVGGGTPSTKEPGNFAVSGHPWVTPADMGAHQGMYIHGGRRFLTERGINTSSAVLLPKGAVVFSSRAPIGYVAIAVQELATNQGCKSFVCEDGILPEFVYFYLRFARPLIEQLASGTTFLEVSGATAARIPIDIPPSEEQRRITHQLAALLAAANASRERLVRVPAILKRFRQSVLAAACSGRLTEEWRDEHLELIHCASPRPNAPSDGNPSTRRRAGRLWGGGRVSEITEEERANIPGTWSWAKVRETGYYEAGAVQVGPMSMQSRHFEPDGVPVLNVGCVQWGYFDESKLNYLPTEKAAEFDRYRIRKGDILFTRSGIIGRCAVAGEEQDGHLMTFHLLRVRPDERKCLSQYLQFVFQGAPHIRRQMDEAAIGSTRAGFNTNLLANLDVPLPPLAEQHEIVRRVQALFDLADAIAKRVAAASARVEKLTQAVLAKAFRGELVPTEAELARQEGRDYEPAAALLERIRRERQEQAAAAPSRKRASGRTGGRARRDPSGGAQPPLLDAAEY
jgi:type I restriction enzyme S subunit